MTAYLKELLSFAISYLSDKCVIKIRATYEFSGTDEYPAATGNPTLSTDKCLIIVLK